MSGNPYQSSPESGIGKSTSPLWLPAGILLVLSLLSAVKWIAGGLYAIINLSRQIDPQYNLYGALDIAIGLVNVVLCVGAVLLLRRTSLRAAWATAIGATIPCLSPCIVLGMPVGIWIILLLRRPEVQAEFNRE